jgi:hypothetical protein
MSLFSLVSAIFVSIAIPSAHASSEDPLEELGEMLGFDSNRDSSSQDNKNDGNSNGNGADDSENTELTSGTLAIPNITQRDEPPASTSSGSLVLQDQFAMNAEFEPHDFLDDYWQMDALGFNVTPNSSICPSGSCEFEFEDGQINKGLGGDWVLTGRLKVGVETEEGTRSTLYDVRGELDRKETLETENAVTDMLGGEFRLGSGSVILPQDIESEYEINNGTLTIEDEDASLVLEGTKQ